MPKEGDICGFWPSEAKSGLKYFKGQYKGEVPITIHPGDYLALFTRTSNAPNSPSFALVHSPKKGAAQPVDQGPKPDNDKDLPF